MTDHVQAGIVVTAATVVRRVLFTLAPIESAWRWRFSPFHDSATADADSRCSSMIPIRSEDPTRSMQRRRRLPAGHRLQARS